MECKTIRITLGLAFTVLLLVMLITGCGKTPEPDMTGYKTVELEKKCGLYPRHFSSYQQYVNYEWENKCTHK